jgi:hypothetical protein
MLHVSLRLGSLAAVQSRAKAFSNIVAQLFSGEPVADPAASPDRGRFRRDDRRVQLTDKISRV